MAASSNESPDPACHGALAVAGRPRAFTKRLCLFCPRARKPRRLRICRSRPCGCRRKPARALRRLGFKTVGALIDKPRAPFAARFAAELLRRLDQALGRVDEPLVPIVAPPVYHSLHYLLEPIVTAEAVVARASRLMQNLVHVLTARRCRRAGVAALPLSRRRRGRDHRYRSHRADAQRCPCGASDRSQARSAGGDGGCRFRLRGHRPCRHPRRTDAGAADRTDFP